MTTNRVSRPLQLAALVAASFIVTTSLMAPSALAQVGGVGDGVGDTVGGASGTVHETAGGATGTVNDTVGGTTDTVNETAGGATDTVNETAGGAAGTVNETVGGAAGTVNETVGGAAGTVTETVGGGSGPVGEPTGTGSAGSEGTTSQSGGGLSGAGGAASGSGGNDVRAGGGVPVPPNATVIKLPDGSTVVIPGNSGGKIDGRKVFGNGDLPKEVLVALNGLTDGFASAGAATPPATATAESTATGGPTFLDNASRIAADAAKKLAFPTTLALIVAAFLMIHGRVGRRDPKLAEARLDASEDVLTFQ